MKFVNGYDLHERSHLTRLVRPLAADCGMLAVGGVGGEAGLALRIDTAGKPIWSRAYRQDGMALRFIDGAPAGDGGFLLLAAAGPPSPQA
jgi:hypothetical protein